MPSAHLFIPHLFIIIKGRGAAAECAVYVLQHDVTPYFLQVRKATSKLMMIRMCSNVLECATNVLLNVSFRFEYTFCYSQAAHFASR